MIVRKGESTRRELYDAIWSKSIKRTAQELGIAPLTLASLCKKHKIPLPPKGFANYRNSGHSAQRPHLPIFPGERRNRVEIFGEPTKRIQLKGRKSDGTIFVPIPVITQEPFSHPLVERTQRYLARAKPDDAGIMVSEQGLVEHLKVSLKVLPRALRILNALFIAFDQDPFSLHWPDNSNAKLTIKVLGEDFSFSVTEIVVAARYRPNSGERSHLDVVPSETRNRSLEASSRLQLVIEVNRGHRLRCIWSDVTRHPLEVCLSEFLDALVGLAQARIADRFGKESWRLKWDRKRTVEREKIAKHAEFARESSVVEQALAGWESADKLLQFLKVRESALTVSAGIDQKRGSEATFLWIKQQADTLNALQDLGKFISTFEGSESDD